MPASTPVSNPTSPAPARGRRGIIVVLVAGAVLGAAAFARQRFASGGGDASAAPPPAAPAGGGAAGAPSGSARAGGSQAPLPVEVYVVKPERLETTVPANGTLLAHEAVDLVSELSKRLVKVKAQEGAKVKKGELLFQLDGSDLQAQLARLNVQKRQAKITMERQDKLLAEKLVSQQDWEAARARLDEVEAEIHILNVSLGKTTIRAPFAGTLGLRRVSEGAWVTPQTVLTTLHDVSKLKIDFTLPERFGDAVKIGQKFSFTVTGRGEPMNGTVAAVEPAVQEASRSVLVRGVVENTAGLLPGTFASVEVPLSDAEAWLVPSIAVVPSVKGRSVFVVKDGVARAVEVNVGSRTPERVQILSGVQPGDPVIISNLLRLRDGAPVKVNNQ